MPLSEALYDVSRSMEQYIWKVKHVFHHKAPREEASTLEVGQIDANIEKPKPERVASELQSMKSMNLNSLCLSVEISTHMVRDHGPVSI